MLFFSLAPADRPDDLYEDCIERIALGDRDALCLLYNETRSAVYGFALSIAKDAGDAEDILQDTFVSVHSAAASYKRMGKPLAWMLTITRNLALMRVRKRQRTSALSEEEWGAFIADAAPVSSEDRVVLTAALSRVSHEESQIVMLHAVAGFKHREIAEVLGMPLSSVLSKYSRALKKLKSMLQEGEFHAR